MQFCQIITWLVEWRLQDLFPIGGARLAQLLQACPYNWQRLHQLQCLNCAHRIGSNH